MSLLDRSRYVFVSLSLLCALDCGHTRIQLGRHLEQPIAPQGITERNVAASIPAVLSHFELVHRAPFMHWSCRQDRDSTAPETTGFRQRVLCAHRTRTLLQFPSG